MLESAGDMNSEFKGMLDAWTLGDVKEIEAGG